MYVYRIDCTATERTWPAPMMTDSSSNQTIGVILVFMRHPLIGFVCRQTVMHTVYNKRGQKASGVLQPEVAMYEISRNPLRSILLAAAILTLFASSTLSADIKAIRKKADAGDAKAQFNIGSMYENGSGVKQDYAEAARWYRKSAERGDARAQYNLGIFHQNGWGVPLDLTEAVKWYRKAAMQGAASAQYNLGFMYYNGQGVPRNYAEAARWYRKAAEQGDVDATRILGLAYYLGKWVPKDLVQSYFWFSLAASRASGDEYKQASEAKERVAKELTPEKLKEARRMVREWEKSHPRK
jgi:TPR repeat protein